MSSIYLAGETTDFDNPIGWHEELMESYPNHNFINPYEVNDVEVGTDEPYDHPERIYEPAMDAVRESDGVLVRWNDNVPLSGTVCEIKEAFDNDIPIVLRHHSDRMIHIKHMVNGIYDDIDKCVKVLELLIQRR